MTEEIKKLQIRYGSFDTFGLDEPVFQSSSCFNPTIYRSSGGFNPPIHRSSCPPGGLEFNDYPIEVKTAFVIPDPGKEQVFHNVKNFLKKITFVVKIKILGEPLE